MDPKGKVLKSCIRCRRHKTKCDAYAKKPNPCTNCSKKNLSCKLEVISFKAKKPNTDVVNSLSKEIAWLNSVIDNLLYNKSVLIKNLNYLNPSPAEIQDVLKDDTISPVVELDSTNKDFVISADSTVSPVFFSIEEATGHFQNYHTHFHKYLPILPDSFYTSDISSIYQENALLFWCIILTSLLNGPNSQLHRVLSKHIKSLVVKTCWLSTPRSVYVLVSLLILTTWPIPLTNDEKITDNLSIKYLSLLKSLSLQLGLHRLQFIKEFSHKTNLNLSNVALDDLIRERIYKFITINSNYWLINLGLVNLNFNGFQQDYIINKANSENQNTSDNSDDDKYINSLLKVSIVQQRLNENLNEKVNEELNIDESYSINNHYQSKLIYLNMFEVILDDLQSSKSNIIQNNLIKLSVQYSKLQLYLYTLDGQLNLPLNEYKTYIYKVLKSCFSIVSLFKAEFNDIYNVNQLPIHYKFIIELVALLLMKIFYSPLLNSVADYESVKENFHFVYEQLSKNQQEHWSFFNTKFTKVLIKFNDRLSKNLLNYLNFINSYHILNKFNNYQISNINYELIWSIYTLQESEKKFGWDKFGIQDNRMIEYLDNISLL